MKTHDGGKPIRAGRTTVSLLQGAIVFAVTALPCCAIAGPLPLQERTSLPAHDVAAAIENATGYLLRNCTDSGRFVYRRHANPDVTFPPKYNLLRHAGSIYALAEAYKRQPSDELLKTMTSASNWLVKSFCAGIPDKEGVLAIWTRPDDLGYDPAQKPEQVKLGGVGLGLVALLSAEQVAPGTTSTDTLVRLGRFLLYMQREDGSFHSKYYPGKGPDDSWQSLYYPGEAMLALGMLYEHDGGTTWLDAAVKGMTCLAQTRTSPADSPADHWALLASEVILRNIKPDSDALPSRAAIEKHATFICEKMLSEQVLAPDTVPHGSFLIDARTCPAAIRLEGLQAALRFLPDRHGELRNRMSTAVHEGVGFLLRTQIKGGPLKGGLPRAAAQLKPATNQNRRFNARAGEIRIDYVQHALSALLAYERRYGRPTAPNQPAQ